MVIAFDAPVSPTDLTYFMRRVPIPADNVLLPAFPVKKLNSNTIDFGEIVKTNRTARFRSFDGRIHVSERDSSSQTRVSLLPLSDSLNKGEYERLQEEFARTSGTNRAVLADAIYNDAENLTNNVYNRLEQAWGDVLTDGKLTINENGFQGEADFGIPAGHIVTAGTLWSNVAAPALDNIRSWADTYFATNGVMPGAIRVSLAVVRNLQKNTQIINAAIGAAAGRTSATIQEINNLLATEGLPPITVQSIKQVDVDGVTTPTLPSDRLFFTPENFGDLGYTAWGVSATALELVKSSAVDFGFSDAPGIAGVVEKVGPPYREFTYADATAMPILAAPKLIFVAKVA